MFVIQWERWINAVIYVFLNMLHLLLAMIYNGLGMEWATSQWLSITLFLRTSENFKNTDDGQQIKNSAWELLSLR